MLDLHRLRLLQEFAARGSIARTAAVLGYTPSAVSQQLAALEREAGTALLDRSARRAELTDAGRRLAVHAERILAMVEEAETDLSAEAEEPAGRVVATAFPSAAVAFAPALARSLRAHPRLTLVLRQTGRGRGPAPGPVRRGRRGHRGRLDQPAGRGGRRVDPDLLPPDQGPARAGAAAHPPGGRPVDRRARSTCGRCGTSPGWPRRPGSRPGWPWTGCSPRSA